MTENQRKPVIRFSGFTDAWEQRKLGNLCKIIKGRGLSKDSVREGESKKCILYGHLYTEYGMFIKNIKYGSLINQNNPVYSEIGDVLIPSSDTTPHGCARAASISESGVILGGDINVIRPPKYINGDFLSLTLNHERLAMIQIIRGTTVRHLNGSDLSNLCVHISTNKTEQSKISAIFLHLDDLITLHQREYDKTLNIKKAMLEKMFPKNGEDRPEIRFAGFTDAWEQRKLGDISEIKTGSSDTQDAVLEGIYPFFVRSDEVQRSNKYLYDGEAILIPGEGRLGEIYHYTKGKFDFHQRVYKISDFDGIYGRFIFYEMQHSFKHHALKNTAKATVDSIRLPTLTEYEIRIPSIGEQGLIGTFFEHLDNLITLHQRELKKLQNMKKALLEKMFVQG